MKIACINVKKKNNLLAARSAIFFCFLSYRPVASQNEYKNLIVLPRAEGKFFEFFMLAGAQNVKRKIFVCRAQRGKFFLSNLIWHDLTNNEFTDFLLKIFLT